MTDNKLSRQEMKKTLGGVGNKNPYYACCAITDCPGNTTISVCCDLTCSTVHGKSVSCQNINGSGDGKSCGEGETYLN